MDIMDLKLVRDNSNSISSMNTTIAETVKVVASDAVERLGALMSKSDEVDQHEEEQERRGLEGRRRLPPRRWKSADPSPSSLPRHYQHYSRRGGRRSRSRRPSPTRTTASVTAAVTDNTEFQNIIDNVAVREDDMRRLLEQDPGALNAIKGYFKRGGAITNASYKEGINTCIHQLAAAHAAAANATKQQESTTISTPITTPKAA